MTAHACHARTHRVVIAENQMYDNNTMPAYDGNAAYEEIDGANANANSGYIDVSAAANVAL